MKKLFSLLAVFICLSANAAIRTSVVSASSLNWGSNTTWAGGVVPTSSDTAIILAGSTVTMTTSSPGNFIGRLELSGTLSFVASAGTESLTVNGDFLINAGGVFNPYVVSLAGRALTVYGNFTNNGTVDLSRSGFKLTMAQASTATTIGGSGTFSTGVIRELIIDNSNGVTLAVPLSVSVRLTLTNGIFSNGSNLTVDQTVLGNAPSGATFIQISRSQCSSLASTYTVGASAAVYVSYTQNVSGVNTNSTITEGLEMPASRSFYSIIINNPNGVNILDDITLKSSASCFTLTSGVINVATGKTLTCTANNYAGVAGTATSYINGAVALTVSTTASTRTFPIGSNGQYRKVVLTNLKSTTGNVTVRFGIETPTGGTGSGVTLSAARRYNGSITSGTLAEFTAISIDYGADDAVAQGSAVIASSATLGGSYASIGTGTNTATTIVSLTGSYASLGYYALATPVATPVTLIGFTAQLKDKKVSLKWSTATEINSKSFVVEYSTNGIDFSSIASIAAKGNSAAVQQYEAWHDKPINGINYYRLKQYDLDGKTTVFNTEKVWVNGTNGLAVSVYPNPVQHGAINLQLNSTRSGQVQVTIKDVNGKTISIHTVNAIEGNNNITLHKTLAKGVYFVSVYDGSTIKSTQLIAD